MADPDFKCTTHRSTVLSDSDYDKTKLKQAEQVGLQMRAKLRRGLTPGYVFGTDLGHNNGPVFSAQPDDTSDPRHSNYGNAYGKVFST